jgi:hypothetical protein
LIAKTDEVSLSVRADESPVLARLLVKVEIPAAVTATTHTR